jgi:hypothetical protein
MSGGIPVSTSLAHPGDHFRHGSEKIFLSARMSDPSLIPRLTFRVRVLCAKGGTKGFAQVERPLFTGPRRERIAVT